MGAVRRPRQWRLLDRHHRPMRPLPRQFPPQLLRLLLRVPQVLLPLPFGTKNTLHSGIPMDLALTRGSVRFLAPFTTIFHLLPAGTRLLPKMERPRQTRQHLTLIQVRMITDCCTMKYSGINATDNKWSSSWFFANRKTHRRRQYGTSYRMKEKLAWGDERNDPRLRKGIAILLSF